MAIWFTSDTHFGSERHLDLCRRPYRSVREMDSDMIHNWNTKVGVGDTVYVLGDFGNYNVVGSLLGNVILITGNYERKDYGVGGFNEFRKRMIHMGFKDVIEDVKEIIIQENGKDINVKMVHEPSRCDVNVFNLFGHIHGTIRAKKFGLNVGCECHNYAPIGIEDVLFYKMAIKECYDEEVWL